MYSWNADRDSEIWNNGRHETIEECITSAKQEGYKVGETIFIGRCVDFEVSIDAGNVIDILQEEAYEHCGEASDGWIDWKNDNVNVLSERLTKCVNEWLKETNQEPYFYYITDIKPLTLK